MSSGLLKIGIIGGGVGGMTVALALRKKKFDVEIFERLPFVDKAGAGIQISPNGMRILRAIGLEKKIIEIGNVPSAIEFLDVRTNKLITNIPIGSNIFSEFGAGFYQIHRADLITLLHQELLTEGVKLKFGNKAVIGKTNSDSASLLFADNEKKFDLIIAADGVGSKTRDVLFGEAKPLFLKQVAYRALINASLVPQEFQENKTKVFLGSGFHAVSYPLRGHSIVNFVFCVDQDTWNNESWYNISNKRELLSSLPQVNALLPVIENLDSVNKWGLFGRSKLKSWSRGRVVLLGDACHPMLPYLAQGATQAIEDAWVLAEQLTSNGSQVLVGDKLDRYYRQRSIRAYRVQNISARNRTIFHLRNPILRLVIFTSLRLLRFLFPNAVLIGFRWLYGGGPIPLKPSDGSST